MKITLNEAVSILAKAEDILILSHQFPDGDTLGSSYALAMGLKQLSKRVRVECSDPIPHKYDYFTSQITFDDFAPKMIVAVDVADPQLLGSRLSPLSDQIDLCIDHHLSNSYYAKHVLLEDTAATTEIIWQVLSKLGVKPDKPMAEAIYTGMITDTGCFRYSNTTAQTLRIAADLMEYDIEAAKINRSMFEVKSRARFEMERTALDSIEYYFGGTCAIMYLTQEMIQNAGAKDSDLEGLPPLTRQIEGVKIGVTIREKTDGSFKISLRTGSDYDASKICAKLLGGGHARAAGCSVTGSLTEAKEQILTAISEVTGQVL